MISFNVWLIQMAKMKFWLLKKNPWASLRQKSWENVMMWLIITQKRMQIAKTLLEGGGFQISVKTENLPDFNLSPLITGLESLC